jgi:hypothetical protein
MHKAPSPKRGICEKRFRIACASDCLRCIRVEFAFRMRVFLITVANAFAIPVDLGRLVDW